MSFQIRSRQGVDLSLGRLDNGRDLPLPPLLEPTFLDVRSVECHCSATEASLQRNSLTVPASAAKSSVRNTSPGSNWLLRPRQR
jgi:hypothetical protein